MTYQESNHTTVFNRFVVSAAVLALALPFLASTAVHAQSTKRGLGLSAPRDADHLDLNTARLANMNVAWYYDWSYDGISSLDSQYDFVHMVFSGNDIGADPVPSPPYAHILGFNEPDNAGQQTPMSPSTALKDWPAVVARGTFVVSPATAQNPITGQYPEGSGNSSWLSQFMAGNPHVNAVAVHHYGCNAATLQQLLTDIHNQWGKPIWLTEFACETESEAAGSGSHPSQADVDSFIGSIKPFLDNTSWIQRYVWHDALKGTSALFTVGGNNNDDTSSSTLSETGNLVAGH